MRWFCGMAVVSICTVVTTGARADVPAPPGPTTAETTAATTTPAEAATQPATVTPAADELLDRVAKAYAAVPSLELAGHMTVDLDVGDSPTKQSPAFAANFNSPSYFRHQVTDDALVGGTGAKTYLYLPRFHAYYLRDVLPVEPGTRPGVTSAVDDVLRRQNLSLLLALAPDPKQVLATWFVTLDRAPDVTIDNVAMPALIGADPAKQVTIVFDPQTLLVRRVTYDLHRQFLLRGEDQVRRAVIEVDYATTKLGSAPTDPAAYAWSPPDGARDATDEVAQQHNEHPAESRLGKPAPPFTAKDLNGNPVALTNYRGRVVVIAFWATWCPACMVELPHVQAIYDALKAKHVEFLAINLKEDAATVKTAVDERKWTFPVLLDLDGSIATALGGEPPPVTFVVGKTGVITAVLPGYDESAGTAPLEQAIDHALRH